MGRPKRPLQPFLAVKNQVGYVSKKLIGDGWQSDVDHELAEVYTGPKARRTPLAIRTSNVI
jgi:hypothetical protein